MKIDLKSKAPTPAAAFLDMMGGSKPEGGIVQLNIDNLRPFSSAKYPTQPFRQYSRQKLSELADSISANGLLSPVIVRPMPNEGTYQILAGHNRTAAAKLAGLTTIPCIVREVDDDIAIMILTDTNLNQRENILPSEKAFAYKMQMEAIKHQGQRNDLATSRTLCAKSDAGAVIADRNNESKRNIQYYIRLTYLIKPLLDLVDSEDIPFRAGVNISYLTEDQQQVLYDYCAANETRINLRYSEQIKALADSGEFSEQTLDELFRAKERRPPRSIKVPMKSIRQYFDGMDDQQITRKVIEIIRHHYDAG